MIGIIGAMEDELTLLRSVMENNVIEKSGIFEFIQGKLESKDAVLLRSGIGKVNAAVSCAVLIQHYKPKLVINTGVAGGIDPALSFGDIIIANGLLYHDVDVTAFNYKPGQLPGQPPIFPVAEKYLLAAENAMDELKAEKRFPEKFNHVRGIIGSGDVFMHQKERIDAVRLTFPEIKAVEMESAAIAHTCYLFDVPFLIIRSLSDIAGHESPKTFQEYTPFASENSADLVRRIVKNL